MVVVSQKASSAPTTLPRACVGDIVMANQMIVPHPRFSINGVRRENIPAGTLGLVRNRVVGQTMLFVDFGISEVYVEEHLVSVVDEPDFGELAEQFPLGSNLIHLALSQRCVIFDLQAQLSRKADAYRTETRDRNEEFAALNGDLKAAQAALEASEKQLQGLRGALSEMEHLERQRHLSAAGRSPVLWTSGPVGDNSFEDNGWTFGGERRDPETQQVSAWRWFRDRIVESDSLDGCR